MGVKSALALRMFAIWIPIFITIHELRYDTYVM